MEIFVGCSTSNDIEEKYLDLAYAVGKLIAKKKHKLIFGSSKIGMMGKTYLGVRENKGKVISVIPKNYRGVLDNVEADKEIITETTSDQLKILVNSGDITIILPGGYGTLAELATSIQCRKVGEHNKEIYIINLDGYYDEILEIIDKFYKEGFDNYPKDKLYKVLTSLNELETLL